MIFKTEFGEYTYKDLGNVLITAFEGGSNYWMQIGGSILPMGTKKLCNHEVPFIERGQLKIIDYYGGGETYLLDKEKIQKGLELMLNFKYTNGNLSKGASYFRNHNWGEVDSEIADVFLQLCLFGSIEYS